MRSHYDFLSNVSTQIQEDIENRDRNDILNWILTSPLLASSTTNNSINNSTSNIVGANTTVGHNSFIEDSSYTRTGIEFFSSTQVGITQVGMGEAGFTNSGIFKDNSAEIDSAKITLAENGIAEINSLHVAIPTKTTFVHTRSDKLDKTEIGFVESASSEISFTEVGSVIDTSNDDIINPVATSEATLGEIFFSSSVPSEQFFSIHETTPQTINNLNHTATNIWSNLLQTSTQLDINFQITDLPTGQLAEATITDFDKQGTPNAGTILIDHDANGAGWFIDRTR